MSMDEQMDIILRAAHDRMYPNTSYSDKNKRTAFYKAYQILKDVPVEELSWDMLCEYAEKTAACRAFLNVTVELLERHLLKDKHLPALYRVLPDLKKMAAEQSIGRGVKNVFCGEDIDNIYFVPTNNLYLNRNKKYSLFYSVMLPYKNEYLRNEIFHFLKTTNYNPGRRYAKEAIAEFELSLGEGSASISMPSDFTDIVFWKQVSYYRKAYHDDNETISNCLSVIALFYRYLVNEYPNLNLYADTLHMSQALLRSTALVKKAKDGYYVLPFSHDADVKGHDKIVVLLRGYESESTRLKHDDFRSIDFSGITCDFYRNELFRYFFQLPISYVCKAESLNYIADTLSAIFEVKMQHDYPNPDLKYLTNAEAVFIKDYLNKKDAVLATKNNRIGATRRFFLWERDDRCQMQFDDLFFEYLVQYEEPSKNTGKAIPDEDLGKISKYFAAKASEDHIFNLAYTILHLCIETEFRVSQICHLEIDCIKPSAKSKEYVVQSYHKSGHGRKDSFVITEMTYRHLMRTIDFTEPYREACVRPEMAKYIFLFKGNNNSMNIMDAQKFRVCLQTCCRDLGLPIYSSRNLRDTHMTKSFEYVLKHGKSDLVMTALSKHKYLDTTKSHYIEQKLNDMLEATYGIIIGDLDDCYNPSVHIVEKIPADIEKNDNIVENGCGNCKSAQCTMRNALPCLICDNFITTIKHEPAFRRAIEAVDKLIQNSGTKHDKDDLTTIKLLLVMYLKAIYQKKQEATEQ